MEHTPTPWRIKDSRVSEAPEIISDNTTNYPFGRRIAKVLYHGGSEDSEVLGNAAFIVEACNAYENLKAQRDALLEVVKDLARQTEEGYIPSLAPARKAIALCEKMECGICVGSCGGEEAPGPKEKEE